MKRGVISDFDAENESVETSAPIALVDSANIEPLIHTVRGQQVMLVADLARLYEVETKNLNRAAARNADRFPEDFRFQLTKEEDESLRCQIGTSKTAEGRGGRRYLPYAYTEQGIAMLSGVLRSEVAVQASISIMRAFVAMRHFLAENATLLERLRGVELNQTAFQQSTDEPFDQVFHLLEGEVEKPQRIFFAGQMFDAFSLLTDLVGRAEREIALVDGYADVHTLNTLAKKREGVQGDRLHLRQPVHARRRRRVQRAAPAAHRPPYQGIPRPLPHPRQRDRVPHRRIPQGRGKEVLRHRPHPRQRADECSHREAKTPR